VGLLRKFRAFEFEACSSSALLFLTFLREVAKSCCVLGFYARTDVLLMFCAPLIQSSNHDARWFRLKFRAVRSSRCTAQMPHCSGVLAKRRRGHEIVYSIDLVG
jgi:hypothetical protein